MAETSAKYIFLQKLNVSKTTSAAKTSMTEKKKKQKNKIGKLWKCVTEKEVIKFSFFCAFLYLLHT